MADIAKITLPNGSSYDFKDSVARNGLAGKADASHTHTKSQITDFPTIPTKTSQLTNDSGFKTTDSNTTYSLSKSGSTITLTGSDGSKTSVTDSDTNTWRGIQNNLTSDSTTDSLSAAQGKVLKGLVDGKAAASHTHSYLLASINGASSINTNTSTGYFHYKYNVNVGTEGLFDTINNANAIFHFNRHAGNYDSQLGFSNNGRIYYRSCSDEELSTKSWFTLAYTSDLTWNNVSGKPSSFTPASHTHNYAGSSSAGGSATSAVKLDTASAGSATQPVYWTGGKPAACTYTLGKSVPSDAKFTDTNTHYTTHLYAGTSSGVANASTTNGNTYLILTDDSTVRNRVKIAGSGATSVTSDANGVITISSTDTNTTYSAATTSTNGLMTSAMVTKLNGIATGATKNSINTYDVSIAVADWATNSNGGYKCTKTVSGILATDEIFADVSLSSDVAAAKLQVAAWACVCNGNIFNSANNTVDFYCYDTKPSAALTIRLTVVR